MTKFFTSEKFCWRQQLWKKRTFTIFPMTFNLTPTPPRPKKCSHDILFLITYLELQNQTLSQKRNRINLWLIAGKKKKNSSIIGCEMVLATLTFMAFSLFICELFCIPVKNGGVVFRCLIHDSVFTFCFFPSAQVSSAFSIGKTRHESMPCRSAFIQRWSQQSLFL